MGAVEVRGRLAAFFEKPKQRRDTMSVAETADPNDLVIFTMKTITAACNFAMPRRKRPPPGRKSLHWWTAEIAELRTQYLAARRKMQRSRDGQAQLVFAYKQAKKELWTAIKSSKRRCWKELCRTVDNDPWGLPYRIVTKKLVGKQQIPGLACPARMREIVRALFPKHEKRSEIALPIGDEAIPLFSIEELQLAAKRLHPGKAPGPDHIPNEVLREIVETWPELFLETFNRCLMDGTFHARWKKQLCHRHNRKTVRKDVTPTGWKSV